MNIPGVVEAGGLAVMASAVHAEPYDLGRPPLQRFIAQRHPDLASSGPGNPASATSPGASRVTAAGEEAARAGATAPPTPRATRRVLPGRYPTEFGVLAELVADARVTDVFVNGSTGTWVDRGFGLTPAPGIHLDERELRDLAVRLVSLGGRHIDETSPCVDTRLEGGIRVHAVLPPISTAGTLLSVRLPVVEASTFDWLDEEGFFAVVDRASVTALVERRENILVTGAGGSGKTTFLAAFLAGAAATERIIAIEDVAELRVGHAHFLSLEARQANLEGAGELGVGRLVREALRMRPDRLVLGECRGPEIRELLSALNTGHDGGGGTLHANSLADVPARLEALGALAGMSPVAIARQAVSAIGTVLHLERSAGTRRLTQVGRFELDSRDRLVIVPTAGEGVTTASSSPPAAGDLAPPGVATVIPDHPALTIRSATPLRAAAPDRTVLLDRPATRDRPATSDRSVTVASRRGRHRAESQGDVA